MDKRQLLYIVRDNGLSIFFFLVNIMDYQSVFSRVDGLNNNNNNSQYKHELVSLSKYEMKLI